MMILPTFDCEYEYWRKGARVVVGVDEAGRGPLAGPVVAGAVTAFPEQIENLESRKEFRLIRDSKALSPRQRDMAFEFIAANLSFGVGWSSHETVDRINILQAAYLAMKKAVSDLKRKLEGEIEILLVDGRSPIPNMSMQQENVIGGDKLVFSIAAASIVAKVTRDRMMLALHDKFPNYGFAKHKGYGTKSHFEMLQRFGPCEIHRKSFRLSSKKA